LGGNFALRMALQAPAAGIELAKVIAVCPPILPLRSWLDQRIAEILTLPESDSGDSSRDVVLS
jgi:hypothetical protein